jgi:di/tricarboxylate transporter
MIPLSFAAIAGGTCTLIGTSINLVANGLLIEHLGTPGLGLFELAWVGLPVVAVVIVFVTIFSHWLLPERMPALGRRGDVREYTVEMQVKPGSPLVGRTIGEAGLRQLPGMYLMEIERDGQILPAVSPRERLHDGDRLVFVGIVESVVDLQRMRGLIPATNQVFKLNAPRRDRILVEAVVSNTCPLVGQRVREGRFRSRYNAVIIAAARNGERLKGKIGDIVLRTGDTLLLEARPSFIVQQRNSRDFYLVSRLNSSAAPRHERALLAVGIIVAMVLAVATGALPMLEVAMLAAGLMILTRCTSGGIARRGVDWSVIVVIAASFGIGTALQESGAAQALAESIVSVAGGEPMVSLGLVFLVAALFTAPATNNAAAVLMFPVALATAQDMSVDVLPFAITIMMGASDAFATPIGYQTNLMVYGVGGYRFGDYLRIGLPLTLLVGLMTVAVVPRVWGF